MRSSFFEFNVATSALFGAKNNLQVISHNIANASMKGYSRQVALQRVAKPLPTFDSKGMVGTGTEVYGVGQIRDIHLDRKYWIEMPVLGEYSIKSIQMGAIEHAFVGLSDTSLSASFKSFFSGLQSLTTNSGDVSYQNNVVKSAESLSKYINNLGNNLKQQQQDINNEISTLVNAINSIGEEIRNLNEQIYKYEIDGSHANDLRDKRALLVDELSEYINVNVSIKKDENNFEKFSVLINGYELVNHFDAQKLEVIARGPEDKKNKYDADGLYDIKFASGNDFNIYSPSLKGELKGLIDIRDGNNNEMTVENGKTTSYKGIPHYIDKLNKLVRTVAKAFNEGLDYKGDPIEGMTGHIHGYDIHGNKNRTFFSDGKYNDVSQNETINYDDFDVFNFQVNSDLIKDPTLLAITSDPSNGESANDIILGFAELENNNSIFREGKIGDFIIGITSELGIDKKQSEKFEKNYTSLVANIDNQRIEVSGVDLNEEVNNMIVFQQQYQTASKFISIINDLYDNLINRVGV